MAHITLTLTEHDLNAAVRDWIEKQGLNTTDRFSVLTTVTRGERPGDAVETSISATGVTLPSTP